MNKERLEKIRDYARRADLVDSVLVLDLIEEVDALRAALEKIAADLPVHDGFSSKSKEDLAKEALGK